MSGLPHRMTAQKSSPESVCAVGSQKGEGAELHVWLSIPNPIRRGTHTHTHTHRHTQTRTPTHPGKGRKMNKCPSSQFTYPPDACSPNACSPRSSGTPPAAAPPEGPLKEEKLCPTPPPHRIKQPRLHLSNPSGTSKLSHPHWKQTTPGDTKSKAQQPLLLRYLGASGHSPLLSEDSEVSPPCQLPRLH